MGVPCLGRDGWGEFQADTISVLALLLNISFYRLATDITCGREKVGMRPQSRQVSHMGKLPS